MGTFNYYDILTLKVYNIFFNNCVMFKSIPLWELFEHKNRIIYEQYIITLTVFSRARIYI